MKIKQLKLPLLALLAILISSFDLRSQPRGLNYSHQKHTIDIVIGGDFGFRMISGDTSNPEISQQVNNRERYEDFKLNTRFGINYNYGITGSLVLKTGIRIANPGFSISSVHKIDPQQDVNTISKSFMLQGLDYKYKYQLIEIPIACRYVFSGSWCKSFVEIGIHPNFYWRTVVKETNYEGASNKKIISENINTVNFMGTLAAGGDFIITDEISGFSQLVARYQFNNLRTGGLSEKIIGLGLELGLRFQI